MPVNDIVSQLADYRGALVWNSYTDALGASHPTTRVDLYIKSHPIPSRKPKFTEVMSVDQYDHISKQSVGFKGVFFTQPDILTVQIQGYIISPINSSTKRWAIKDSSGTLLSALGNINYADLVSLYLSGRMNPNVAGAPQRKDPDQYITPYGQSYSNPVIAIWEPSLTINMKKQQFNATLYLER